MFDPLGFPLVGTEFTLRDFWTSLGGIDNTASPADDKYLSILRRFPHLTVFILVLRVLATCERTPDPPVISLIRKDFLTTRLT